MCIQNEICKCSDIAVDEEELVQNIQTMFAIQVWTSDCIMYNNFEVFCVVYDPVWKQWRFWVVTVSMLVWLVPPLQATSLQELVWSRVKHLKKEEVTQLKKIIMQS